MPPVESAPTASTDRRGREALRPSLVDPRRPVPEPPDRLHRQLEPQRGPAHPRAALPRDRTRSCSGSSPPTRWCSPGCCSPPGRSATGSGGRVRCSSASLGFLAACLLASTVDRDVAAHRLPRPDGLLRRVHHAVDAVDPRQRVPADERAKAIAIWAGVTGAAGAIGPVASGWLLGHFSFGSDLPRQRADHHRGARRRVLPRAEVEGSRGGHPRPGRRDPVDRRDRRARLRTHRGPGQGLGKRRDAGARSLVAAVVLTGFVFWERHRDEPMLDMALLPQPGVQHRDRRDDPRVPGHVRRDVPHHAVLPARSSATAPLSTALRLLPMAPIMMIVAPLTPRIVARFGANRTVAAGLGLVALRLPALRQARRRHAVLVRAAERLPARQRHRARRCRR